MEEKQTEKKETVKKITSFKDIFTKRDNRFIALAILLVPVICFMVFFGINIYKEAKNLLNMVQEEPISGTDYSAYYIESMGYVLRDTATDYQKELFEELRTVADANTDGKAIAESLCKNYVADFYTWTNKTGQYDVGGMYYVFKPERSDIYTQARDGMYKYINTYMEKYGSENLIEVESVTATGEVAKDKYVYGVDTYNAETGEVYPTPTAYDTYLVTCTWTYKENTVFSSAKFDKKMNFVVVNNEGIYQIVEASIGTIDYVEHQEAEEN